ncbi:DUF2628 domain-containing protein [Rhizobium sp. TRM95796]|uniref:DUF2628 domain-containing protein n=1 Tax=Rhizobium sp. TRM95796 TaxID=2979862 RepID=UPI0021E92CAC|nr:DUF2628 domain-containing protein [Rhizobium sp. TRM95796]MCV3767209.1 DUF2628 domain-containing protein [Rhizobium sp. TRM95796]
MASFYALTPKVCRDPAVETLFIRDGFSWGAFLLPLPWMLYRRLWLITVLSVVALFITSLAAEEFGLDGLSLAFGLILSLWTGFEGGHLRAMHLEKKGWRIEDVINAPDIDTAEAIYFEARADKTPAPPSPRPMMPEARPGAPRPSVALGLIEPYGGR